MTFRIVLAVLIAFLGALQATAQSQQPASMTSMMPQCREHLQAASASIDQILKMMDDAQQSNDPTRMRQAMQDAQTRMRDMRQNMSACADMMGQMQNMPGTMGGGGMMGGGGAMPGMGGMMPCMGMMQGMMGGGMSGMMRGGMVAVSVVAVLLGLSLVAALVALTAFLWNRSRVTRPA